MNIGQADSVLIFGPGEAKGEIKKRMDKDKLCKRMIKVETRGKMTNPPIVKKIRKFFLK